MRKRNMPRNANGITRNYHVIIMLFHVAGKTREVDAATEQSVTFSGFSRTIINSSENSREELKFLH